MGEYKIYHYHVGSSYYTSKFFGFIPIKNELANHLNSSVGSMSALQFEGPRFNLGIVCVCQSASNWDFHNLIWTSGWHSPSQETLSWWPKSEPALSSRHLKDCRKLCRIQSSVFDPGHSGPSFFHLNLIVQNSVRKINHGSSTRKIIGNISPELCSVTALTVAVLWHLEM